MRWQPSAAQSVLLTGRCRVTVFFLICGEVTDPGVAELNAPEHEPCAEDGPGDLQALVVGLLVPPRVELVGCFEGERKLTLGATCPSLDAPGALFACVGGDSINGCSHHL